MIVATFGASTAWVGKTITFDEGRFTLEGIGQIQPLAVVDYDRQGHLQWAYVGLREWAYQLAGEPAPAPAAPQPPTPPAAFAAPQPPTPPATVASAQPAPSAGKSVLVWILLGVAAILALPIGIVAAGGRLREGLGIALTLLAIVFIVGLVVALAEPSVAGRWLPGAGARAAQLVCVGAAAACFILAAFLWWMPHYEVVAPSDKRIALDDAPEIKVEVYNRGLLGGTYSATYAVDGEAADTVQFPLKGGQGREMTLPIPGETERGPVVLTLGGASIEAQAVAPPAFAVDDLQVDPSPAKVGDSVVLTTSVKNTGDLTGTFGGVLLVNGNELLKQPVELKPGQTRDVTYDLTADRAGEYELTLGDASARFVIVKPVRLANGYVIKRSAKGGKAYIKVTNKTGSDAVAVLTRASNKKRAVLAVYIRSGKTATIKGIPDGSYVLWDCCGSGFNWTMRDFYSTVEHKRWLQPLAFNTTASTKYWTSHWSDAYYDYSQKHSQTTTHWTNWKVTLGTGESKYTKTVNESGFPQL